MNNTRRSANHVRRTRKLIATTIRRKNLGLQYNRELEYKASIFELAFRISCTKTAATIDGAVDRYKGFLSDAMDIKSNDLIFASDGSFGVRRKPDPYYNINRLQSLQDKRFSDIISQEIKKCLDEIESYEKQ